jgi:oxygen-independent coproporphyrinogen-3 oxidase
VQKIEWSEDLIKKYNINGPRYTSYPTAVQFADLTDEQWSSHIASSNDKTKGLSLYVHIPFCRKICFYCACNKFGTKDQDRANSYLDQLEKEITRYAEQFGDRPVEQLHFGGGTPTFLDVPQMKRLLAMLNDNFNLAPEQGEYSIELDPRTAHREMLEVLTDFGFNRCSFGIQDFAPETQIAINREQSVELVEEVVNNARELGFKSLSFDLIYGLPKQDAQTFSRTLETVIRLAPDRIATYNYAHLPERFKPQRRINEDELPDGNTKLTILKQSIEQLQDAGYEYIGMDHFAKPEDELAQALHNGSLQRNFQGYSTYGGLDMLALGVSSISHISDAFAQNSRDLAEYEALTDEKRPVKLGYILNDEDKLRRHIIMSLACQVYTEFADIENKFGISFTDKFSAEMERLRELEADGLIQLDDHGVRVLPLGRLLLRPILMAFDEYLPTAMKTAKFSKVL